MMNYPQLLHLIWKRGTQVSSNHVFDSSTREIMHVELEVDTDCLFDFVDVRGITEMKKYMFAEMAWFFSGKRDTLFIGKKAKLWNEIRNPDETVNSNYGFLVFYNRTPYPVSDLHTLTPFEWAARCLEQDRDSRQGMVTYNSGAYNFPGNKDYICSQHQAFYIRDNRLLCYVALRSSDVIFGLPYNMAWWQTVYQMMLFRLRKTYPDLKSSPILVTIYSAHIYGRHFILVEKMLDTPFFFYDLILRNPIPLGNSLEWYVEKIPSFFNIQGAA